MLKTEIESAINGKQWLLSCFGPFKESTVIPNLMDRCFEEVRLDFLEASKNGTTQQHVNDLIAQYNDSIAKLNQLKIPSPETLQLVANIYNVSVQEQKSQTSKTTSNFALSNTAAASPQPQANPFQLGNVFGGLQSTSSSMDAGNIFGGQPTASNNIFQSQTQTSIFGGSKDLQQPSAVSNFSFSLSQQTAKSSVFGSAQPTSPQVSLFGAPQSAQQQQQQPMGNSIFGGQPTNTFADTSSIFGTTQIQQQPQQTSSPFASSMSSIFTQSQPAPGQGIFGSPQQPPQPTQIFGQPTAQLAPSFGQPTTVQSQPFGQPSTGNVFGGFQPQSDPMQQQQNVFSHAPVVQSNNVFGVQQSAPHQVPQTQAVAPQPSSSIFQIQQPNANQQSPFSANPFQTPAVPVDERTYSKIESLSAEEIQAFQAPTFELGKIPLKPPPKEFCI